MISEILLIAASPVDAMSTRRPGGSSDLLRKRSRLLSRILAAATAILVLLAVTPAQAAYFFANDESFSYTGTVTDPSNVAYAIPSFLSTPGSTLYTGRDAAIFAAQNAPAAILPGPANTNQTELNPNWWASLDGNNTGNNPNNTNNGYIQLYDPTNAGVTSTTGTWNSSHTIFTLLTTGTEPNPSNNRVWAAPEVGGAQADQSGTFTNYSLTLTATFASAATLTSPLYDWYSTTAAPTSVTGSFIGTFDNTGTYAPGNYGVNLTFQGQNWAGANGIPDNYSGVTPYVGASNCAGASCDIVYGTTNTDNSNSGKGGDVTLSNQVTGLTTNSNLACISGTCALQDAIGGTGYDGYDNGNIAGGNGGDGSSTITPAAGLSGTNYVTSLGQGGDGGTGGTVGGNGGNGTSSLTLNTNNGTSVGLGGNGGWGFPGNGGTGGNGTAGLAITGDVTATVVATGGNGGDSYGAGNGGTGGNGTTTAVTATGLLTTDPVTINVTATGGNGGNVYTFSGPYGNGGAGGAGNVSGAVNGISYSQATPGTGPVTINVQQIGGNGGSATPGTDASGGAAAASTLYTNIVGGAAGAGNVNTINGWTTGTLNITSSATGGNGGDGDGTGTAQPGAAGSATLILNQFGLATNQQSSNLQGTAQGVGGNGGNGTYDGTSATANGANGAAGTAVANMTGYQTVTATANATGGNGGTGATTGLGGSATATAIARSLTAGFNTTAVATATGGSGSTEGEATPLAQAFSIGTGNASATATGTGILTPGNYATAQSTTTSGTTSVAATGKALIGSTEVSQTVTNVGGAVSVLQPATGSYGGAVTTLPAASNMNASIQAQAYGTALPTSSAVIALLDGHPNALTAFGSPSQVLGVGSLAVANSTSAIGTHNYSASLVYNLTPSAFAGQALYVALLDPALTAAPLSSLTTGDLAGLSFTISDSQFSNTYTFSSVTALDSFFTDNVLNLGAMPSTLNNLTFTLDYTTADLTGFGANFAFGEVPEPSTWLVFGSALLGMAFFRLRRREDLLALLRRGFKGGYRNAA